MNLTPNIKLDSDSANLSALLAKTPAGGFVPYAALSALIENDVQGKGRSALNRAREIVRREHRMVFGTVIDQGLKRLDDAGIVGISDNARTRIRRCARRTVKKLICADYANLSRDDQTKRNAALSVFGLLAATATQRSFDRVAAKTEAAGSRLALSATSIAALGGMS